MGAGAVYKPADEIVPSSRGEIDHVTAEFPSPGVSTENCIICRAESTAVRGNTPTELAGTISMALIVAHPARGENWMVIWPSLTVTGMVSDGQITIQFSP